MREREREREREHLSLKQGWAEAFFCSEDSAGGAGWWCPLKACDWGPKCGATGCNSQALPGGHCPITVYKLLCGCWSHEAKFAALGFGASGDLPLEMPLVKLIGSCSDVVWSWPLGVFVMGLLERKLVLTYVRCCLWLVLGNPSGAVPMWLFL